VSFGLHEEIFPNSCQFQIRKIEDIREHQLEARRRFDKANHVCGKYGKLVGIRTKK
jgi:hypothetical protein